MGTKGRAEERADVSLRQLAQRTGETLIAFERAVEAADDDGLWLSGVSVRPPVEGRPEWMLVWRAVVDGRQMVAFTSGGLFHEAVRTGCEAWINRSLRWKEDQYAR